MQSDPPILVVDDEFLARMALKRQLESSDYSRVSTAGS